MMKMVMKRKKKNLRNMKEMRRMRSTRNKGNKRKIMPKSCEDEDEYKEKISSEDSCSYYSW